MPIFPYCARSTMQTQFAPPPIEYKLTAPLDFRRLVSCRDLEYCVSGLHPISRLGGIESLSAAADNENFPLRWD
jgi:hypothetical protein